MNINDIYSDKYKHIYIYNEINDNLAQDIINNINTINNKNKNVYLKPKQIILHINSQGGSLQSGLSIMNTISFPMTTASSILICVPVGNCKSRELSESVTFSMLLSVLLTYGGHLWHPGQKYLLACIFSACNMRSTWSRDIGH